MPHTASPYLVQEEEVDLVVVSDLGSQVKQRRAAPCEPVDVDVGLRGSRVEQCHSSNLRRWLPMSADGDVWACGHAGVWEEGERRR